jgi:hypothetical protein
MRHFLRSCNYWFCVFLGAHSYCFELDFIWLIVNYTFIGILNLIFAHKLFVSCFQMWNSKKKAKIIHLHNPKYPEVTAFSGSSKPIAPEFCLAGDVNRRPVFYQKAYRCVCAYRHSLAHALIIDAAPTPLVSCLLEFFGFLRNLGRFSQKFINLWFLIISFHYQLFFVFNRDVRSHMRSRFPRIYLMLNGQRAFCGSNPIFCLWHIFANAVRKQSVRYQFLKVVLLLDW